MISVWNYLCAPVRLMSVGAFLYDEYIKGIDFNGRLWSGP